MRTVSGSSILVEGRRAEGNSGRRRETERSYGAKARRTLSDALMGQLLDTTICILFIRTEREGTRRARPSWKGPKSRRSSTRASPFDPMPPKSYVEPPPTQGDLSKFLGKQQPVRQQTLGAMFKKGDLVAVANDGDEMQVDDAEAEVVVLSGGEDEDEEAVQAGESCMENGGRAQLIPRLVS